jgi:hypothetical protein
MSKACMAAFARGAGAAAVSVLVCTGALAQSNSINLAFAAAPAIGDLKKGTVAMLEYERMIAPGWTLFARASRLDYKWDDGSYVEKGDGNAFGGGFRFFFNRRMEGFYIGGAVGAFKTDWTWTEPGYAGKGDTKSVQWGAEAGYRFMLSPSFAITPAVNAGSWVGNSDNCSYTAPSSMAGRSCSKESELGGYAALSVSFSFMF